MSDLIDRQAAIDALRTCQTYLFNTHDGDKKISLESAEYMIEQLPSAQPTVDAVPVVHGRWQDEGNLWLCTACGNGYVTEAGVTPIDAGMHYCPNCGARMEGEA